VGSSPANGTIFKSIIMNLKQAKKELDQTSKTLDLNAFYIKKRQRIIAVYHFDGSYLEFHSASFKKLDDEWMAVFTEHHGSFLYHFEDVKWIKEMESNKTKELYRYKEIK
jgi:hypothetical protein